MRYAVIFVDGAGRWRYRVKAANGRQVDQSQSYSRRWVAIRAVRRNRPDVSEIRVEDRSGSIVRTLVRKGLRWRG